MGSLVRSYFAFGAHANIFPLGYGSPLYSITMTLRKSLILLLIFLLAIFPQDSLMSSCNCIIMSFAFFIEPYVGFPDFDYQLYSLSLSHV